MLSNFFDKNFAQSIVTGLIVLLVSIWLSGQARTTSGKRWKVVVIIAYTLILGGLYVLASNVQNGGFANPYVGMGLVMALLGFALKYLGRFFIWWQR